MRIRVNCTPSGGVKTLDDLNIPRLATLEGRNGIGKSMTVRLLQAATGDLPYARQSRPWYSMRSGLGSFEVSVDGLAADTTILIQGESTSWPEDLRQGAPPTWFDSAEINGKSATIEDVRKVLRVSRIAGDETLIDSLINMAELDAADYRTFQTSIEGRAERLATRVNEALALMPGAESADADVDRVTARLASVSAETSDANSRVELLLRAEGARRTLEQHSGDVVQWRKDVIALDQAAHAGNDRLDSINTEVTSLAASSMATATQRKELENARRTLTRNIGKLNESSQKLSFFIEALPDIADRLGDTHPSEMTPVVAHEVESVEATIGRLANELASLDDTPLVRKLIADLSGRLEQAEQEGLGERTVQRDAAGQIVLSVAESHDLFVHQDAALEAADPPADAQELVARIERHQRTRKELGVLADALAEQDNLREIIERNTTRVEAAVAAMPSSDTSQKLRTLEQERAQLQRDLQQTAAQRATLQARIGAVSDAEPSTLGRQLDVELTAANSTIDALDTDLRDARRVHAKLEQQKRTVEEELIGAKQLQEARAAQLTVLKSRLATDLGWLRGQVPGDLNGEALASLRTKLESVRDRLESVRSALSAIGGAVSVLADGLRGDPVDREHSEVTREWMAERYASEVFNVEPVRSQLFSQLSGDIDVDLDRNEVSWSTLQQERIRRPLDAFSSGEQAFAYTRALIDRVADRGENHLIVLDEFGAVIAQDRLELLLEHLRVRVAENPGEHVLVVLPLRRKPEESEIATFEETGYILTDESA